MKVLVISSYQDTWNAVRPEGELFIGLHQKGVEVTIMTQGDAPFAQRFRDMGLPVIDFHPKKKFDKQESNFIREELQRGAYDIVHLFNNKAIINGIRAAKGLPVKVVTYRGYSGNIHWWDPTNYLTHLNPGIDKITCVSPAVKEVFDRQPFFKNDKAVVVSKGHDPAWYQDVEANDLSEFHFPHDAIIACMVANARRMKGMPYFLEALQHLPPALPLQFLLIGRGLDDPKTLAALKQTPFANRVHFTGFRKDVLSLVKASDISILASVKGEGLSKVLLESMFLGRPTIMTNIAGNRGLAIHKESGLIIPPRDGKALAKAIKHLATNTDLRQKLGPAAKAYISEHFSTQKSAEELQLVYQNLIATK